MIDRCWTLAFGQLVDSLDRLADQTTGRIDQDPYGIACEIAPGLGIEAPPKEDNGKEGTA